MNHDRWISFLRKAEYLGSTGKTRNFLASYQDVCTDTLEINVTTITKTLKKVCPRGLILGQYLWMLPLTNAFCEYITHFKMIA